MRAVTNYGGVRKTFVTPYVVTADQAARLTPQGRLKGIPVPTNGFDTIPPGYLADIAVDGDLRRYLAAARELLRVMVETGTYNDTPSAVINAAVIAKMDALRRRQAEALAEVRGVDVKKLHPDWYKPGVHRQDGSLITTAQELEDYLAEIDWEKGGDR